MSIAPARPNPNSDSASELELDKNKNKESEAGTQLGGKGVLPPPSDYARRTDHFRASMQNFRKVIDLTATAIRGGRPKLEEKYPELADELKKCEEKIRARLVE